MRPPVEDTYRNGRRRRPSKWRLNGGDHALVWREGRAQLVGIADATPAERSTGIASVEALAAGVVAAFVRRRHAYMPDDRMADAVAYLIEQAWFESQRFNGTGRLGGFVTARLRWRLVDWYRDEFERRRCATCGGREGREHDARCDCRVFVEVLSLDADEEDIWRVQKAHKREQSGGHAVSDSTDGLLRRNLSAAHEALELPAPERDDDEAFAGLDLSPSGRWTLVHVATPLSNGYTMAEIAARIGRSRASVSSALAELRCELAALGVAP
jgi:hypothetical protein